MDKSITKYLSKIGKLGGSKTSKSKKVSSKENGKLDGPPKLQAKVVRKQS